MSVINLGVKEIEDAIKLYDVDDSNLPPKAKITAEKDNPTAYGVDVTLWLEKNGTPGKSQWLEKIAVIEVLQIVDEVPLKVRYAGLARVTNKPGSTYMLLYCPPGKINNNGLDKRANDPIETYEGLIELMNLKGSNNEF